MPIERHPGDPPSPYEVEYGFSRVVRAGDWVMVGGTTSVDELGFVVGLTPYEQAAVVLRKVGSAFLAAGVSVEQVVSATVYVTDVTRAAEVGRAFGEVFGQVRPLMTLVGVAALIDPRMLVEISAVAWVGD